MPGCQISSELFLQTCLEFRVNVFPIFLAFLYSVFIVFAIVLKTLCPELEIGIQWLLGSFS